MICWRRGHVTKTIKLTLSTDICHPLVLPVAPTSQTKSISSPCTSSWAHCSIMQLKLCGPVSMHLPTLNMYRRWLFNDNIMRPALCGGRVASVFRVVGDWRHSVRRCPTVWENMHLTWKMYFSCHRILSRWWIDACWLVGSSECKA